MNLTEIKNTKKVQQALAKVVKELYAKNMNYNDIVTTIRDKVGVNLVSYGKKHYPLSGQKHLYEAVRKIPITKEDFDTVKEIFNQPLPAGIALYILEGVLEDDGLADEIAAVIDNDPKQDIRELVQQWFSLNMPQKVRHNEQHPENSDGVYSVIHGYDYGNYGRGGY